MKPSNRPSGPPLRASPLPAHQRRGPPRDRARQVVSQSGNSMFLRRWGSPSPPTGRPVPVPAPTHLQSSTVMRPQPCHRT